MMLLLVSSSVAIVMLCLGILIAISSQRSRSRSLCDNIIVLLWYGMAAVLISSGLLLSVETAICAATQCDTMRVDSSPRSKETTND